jgi:hypothetical protein
MSTSVKQHIYGCSIFGYCKTADSTWYPGLSHKVSKLLFTKVIKLIQSFVSSRKFYVLFGGASMLMETEAALPHGSILSPSMSLLM